MSLDSDTEASENRNLSMHGNRYYVLILLTFTASINFVDRQILSVLLEPIGQEFALSDSLLGLLSGIAFAAFYSILGIPIAVLADRLNRRNIIVICISIFSVMTAICGSVSSFMQLFLARIGVGIGEAGTAPASQSIISDLFPVAERPFAMSLLAAGGNIGLMLGLLIGGWVNEWYGWRMAFLAAAAPGVLIALTIWFTVQEPPRAKTPKDITLLNEILEGVPMVSRIPSFRRLAVAGSLYGLSAYGIHTWMPVYYIRYHDMTTGEAGTIISLIVGVLGASGAIAGGALCSKLNQRDLRWSCWLPALSIGISLPLLISMLATNNTALAIGFFIIPGALSSIYAGPTWSLVQELVPNHKRAIAASVYLMIFNLIGLGLGPLFVGILSDVYIPHLGDGSLRWSMISVLMVSVLGIVFYLRAAGSVLNDIRLSQDR